MIKQRVFSTFLRVFFDGRLYLLSSLGPAGYSPCPVIFGQFLVLSSSGLTRRSRSGNEKTKTNPVQTNRKTRLLAARRTEPAGSAIRVRIDHCHRFQIRQQNRANNRLGNSIPRVDHKIRISQVDDICF